jgi:DNA-directed RNA polymerase specialized sigma24 family protein
MKTVQMRNEIFSADSDLERDAVMLAYCFHQSEREAAKVLKVTPNELNAVLRSAAKKLRAQYPPAPPTDAEYEAAVARLPELERRAISLSYYQGLHHRDGAKELGVNRNQYWRLLESARRQLDQEINVVVA